MDNTTQREKVGTNFVDMTPPPFSFSAHGPKKSDPKYLFHFLSRGAIIYMEWKSTSWCPRTTPMVVLDPKKYFFLNFVRREKWVQISPSFPSHIFPAFYAQGQEIGGRIAQRGSSLANLKILDASLCGNFDFCLKKNHPSSTTHFFFAFHLWNVRIHPSKPLANTLCHPTY